MLNKKSNKSRKMADKRKTAIKRLGFDDVRRTVRVGVRA